MYVPLWLLIPAAVLLLVLLLRAFTGGSREMIAGQRAAGFEPGAAHLAALAQPGCWSSASPRADPAAEQRSPAQPAARPSSSNGSLASFGGAPA